MKISICIPTWEQYGLGDKFISHLFETLKNQTFKNFDVIISDQSLDKTIYDVVKIYDNDFSIKYFLNPNHRGNSPANTNNAIRNANGDIVKIIFQDDFFYDNSALELINQSFETDKCNWLVMGSNHITNQNDSFFNPMTPKWNDRILFGLNTISSPSVLAFSNHQELFFDENLTMLMDCEYYYQLFLKFGEPKILSNCLITNRIHNYQISKMYNKKLDEEIEYIKTKYKII